MFEKFCLQSLMNGKSNSGIHLLLVQKFLLRNPSITILLITKGGISCVSITFGLVVVEKKFVDIKPIRDFRQFTSRFPSWVNVHNVLVNVVSSAYKMKLRRSLAVCISFTYITKKDPILNLVAHLFL